MATSARKQPTGKTPPDPALARQRLRLWLSMLKSVRHVESTLRERLRLHYGSTLPRFDVLAILDRAPEGLKMTELSRRLMVSNGNVTGIVDRLIEDGLVVRTPVEGDRRAWCAQLTPQGKAALGEMAAAHLEWIDELFESVDDASAQNVIKCLGGVRQLPEDSHMKET